MSNFQKLFDKHWIQENFLLHLKLRGKFELLIVFLIIIILNLKKKKKEKKEKKKREKEKII